MRVLTFLVSIILVVISLQSSAQLNSAHEVVVTIDVQPFLQLKMEGPEQLDFTFGQIQDYYAGITKYGVTVLKVSATVSWDLWAAGLSNGSVGNFLWDNPAQYQVATDAFNTVPITALELHQTPENPSIALGCLSTVAQSSDYSRPFQMRTGINTISSNNTVYAPSPGAPYTSPTSAAAMGASEKYIAGGTGTGGNCQVAGGSYILQATTSSSYYYSIDYRIIPGLPVVFPAHDDATTVNSAAAYVTNADAATNFIDNPTEYAQPGIYTMYVKYILAQDQ
ncbi:MAG: hypothetical protein J0M08_13280 [Bacteroidetes bacterium]|nr:hypothetical protein [Bacteroidota bacterium]